MQACRFTKVNRQVPKTCGLGYLVSLLKQCACRLRSLPTNPECVCVLFVGPPTRPACPACLKSGYCAPSSAARCSGRLLGQMAKARARALGGRWR